MHASCSVGRTHARKKRFLCECHSATTTFNEATMYKTPARMKYTCQLMHEYVWKWGSCAAQLSLVDAPMDEKLLVAMFTDFFANRFRSLYGMALSAMITRKNLTRQ